MSTAALLRGARIPLLLLLLLGGTLGAQGRPSSSLPHGGGPRATAADTRGSTTITLPPFVLDLTRINIKDLRFNSLLAANKTSAALLDLAQGWLQSNPTTQARTAMDNLWASLLLQYPEKQAQYANLNAAAKTARLNVVARNLRTIANTNVKNANTKARWFAAANQYIDMSDDEFRVKVLEPDTFDAALPGINLRLRYPDLVNVPWNMQTDRYVNWNAIGKVTSIKSQGGCGSCWAHSAIAAVESLQLIGTNMVVGGTTTAPNPLLDLAEQQLVDCVRFPYRTTNGKPYTGMGCGGGWSEEAFTYMLDKKALTESLYPWKGVTAACNNSIINAAPAGQWYRGNQDPPYANVQARNTTALMRAIKQQPVVFYFRVEPSWRNYGGGIYDTECTYKNATGGADDRVNHAMLYVGYSYPLLMGGDPAHLIVKNSWGTGWGEDGFARLKMGADGGKGLCRAHEFLMYPRQAFP